MFILEMQMGQKLGYAFTEWNIEKEVERCQAFADFQGNFANRHLERRLYLFWLFVIVI